MSQRLHDTTKWIWCLLVLYSGPVWNPVRCVTVRSPPSNPAAAVEAQAKFFQDFFSVQLSPYNIEFGHVCEDPNTWEQRYEKKDFKNHRDMGKVRWGDKKGGYGEHYWDLNHAGHTDNHGHDGYDDGDDGSFHDRDSYDEPSEESPNYDTANYNSEKATAYDDNGRAKRAPKRIKVEKVQEEEDSYEEEKPQVRRKPARKQKEQKEVEPDDDNEEEEANQEVHRKPVKQRRPQKQQQPEPNNSEEYTLPKEKSHIVLVVDEKEKEEQKPPQYVQRQAEPKLFVPYESGAGVRQHHQAEATAAASAPRLFLEPTTGHVVDRATGQAYVLQPIVRNPTYIGS